MTTLLESECHHMQRRLQSVTDTGSTGDYPLKPLVCRKRIYAGSR